MKLMFHKKYISALNNLWRYKNSYRDLCLKFPCSYYICKAKQLVPTIKGPTIWETYKLTLLEYYQRCVSKQIGN